jgi:hypothetical protein
MLQAVFSFLKRNEWLFEDVIKERRLKCEPADPLSGLILVFLIVPPLVDSESSHPATSSKSRSAIARTPSDNLAIDTNPTCLTLRLSYLGLIWIKMHWKQPLNWNIHYWLTQELKDVKDGET